ncbi:hypothetical protein IW262DRAFT_1292777 [Armillaria fumosa]|nr:hypothetical protein IW262DRAFT_1292777 [Armillaria fumosa]
MALVQLCPQDTAWEECCRKLNDLVQNEDGDFFSKQLIWEEQFSEHRPLEVDEIQVKKDNIRYAIHVLDDFFNGGEHAMATLGAMKRYVFGKGLYHLHTKLLTR